MATIHRRPLKILADDLVGFFIRMRDSAVDLGCVQLIGHKTEERRFIITRLRVQLVPRDCAPIKSGWRACFQPAQG